MKKLVLFLIFLLFFSPIFVLAEEKININSASLGELDKLTGVGPAYAQRIIDARPFSSIDDLLRVKGIGEKTLQGIKDQGLACVDCESTQISNSEFLISNENQNIQSSNPPNIAPDPTPVIYPGGIVINEIMPNPEGPDETEEWIELYNTNNFSVSLVGWKIKDSAGAVTTYNIKSALISANGFLTFKRPDTKISLNNDGDSVYLLNPNGETISSTQYTKAPLGQSYNLSGNEWHWSSSPTPNSQNIIQSDQTDSLSNLEESVKNNVVNQGLANISQFSGNNNESHTQNPWFLFYSALVISIISAGVVIFIKLKLARLNNPPKAD